MLAVDLRTKLLAVCPTANKISQNKIEQPESAPYIWYGRAGIDPEDSRTLDQAAGVNAFREQWDVEIYAADPATADTLAQAIRALDCYRGALGDGTVQGIFAFDHTDDYIPRGINSDTGFDAAFLRLEIVGYQT